MNKNIAFYIILVTDALYLILAILGLCVHGVNDWRGFALTVAIGLLGVMCGWVIGFLASPTSDKEKTALNEYTKTISVFISGYLTSKIVPMINEMLTVEHIKKYLLFSPVTSLRAIIFSYCFLSGTLLMYVSRSYFNAQSASEKAKTEGPPETKPAASSQIPPNQPGPAPTDVLKPAANSAQEDAAPTKQSLYTKIKSLFGGPATS